MAHTLGEKATGAPVCRDCRVLIFEDTRHTGIEPCRLHAAAPRLLEALEALRHEYLRILIDYGSHVRGTPEIQALADDAIAEAKGDK